MGLLSIQQSGAGGLRRFHEGPSLQSGSGLLGLLLRGATKILPKVLGGSKALLKASAKGIQKAATSETAKELGRNLKDIAISTAADSVASAVSGRDPTMSLQQGVDSARQEIADTLKRKASEHRQSKNKKRKFVPLNKGKSRKKKKNGNYNLFE